MTRSHAGKLEELQAKYFSPQWNSLAQHQRTATTVTFLWPAWSTGKHLPSKPDVVIPLLSCPSQLWLSPWPGDTESPVLHPGVWLCQQPGWGQSRVTAAGSPLAPCKQKGVPAGSWRVASPGSSWRMSTMAAVSYLEVEELRSHDVTSQDKRNVFLLLPSANPSQGTGASESLLCKHQICWLTGNSNTKATMKVKL